MHLMEIYDEYYRPVRRFILNTVRNEWCVFGLVNHLPEPLRSVIILSDVDEFSQQEIADIIGITVANVKTRLHRARKKLKGLLEEHCVFEVDERNFLTCQPEKTKLAMLLIKPLGS